MKKSLGVRVGRRLLCVWRWVRRRRRQTRRRDYLRLPSNSAPPQAGKERRALAAKIAHWRRFFLRLRPTVRACSSGGDEFSGDYQLLSERRPKTPPKGYLAVYVALDAGELPHRVVVPVAFFKHPLFVELLQKAESEFGFQQSGGIIIPCPVSDFEGICTVVAAEVGRRRRSCTQAGGRPRRLLSFN